MSINKNNLIYALKEGKTVYISEVDSGLKCNCTCPACGEKLVAKKGQKMMHHFAHQAKSECEYGYQTSLHLAAKDILTEQKTIILPEVLLDFNKYGGSYKTVKISDPIEITFDNVILEKKQGDIIPDVIAYSGNKKVYIEIYVTHAIDENKLNRIKKENISTIEVDLSKIDRNISKEELTEILINNNAAKKWIYNKIENEWYQRFISNSIKLKVKGSRVNHCPISKKRWQGPPYAIITQDCYYCDYCTDVTTNNDTMETYILCSGKARLSEIEDFNTPLEKRIEITDAKIEEERIEKIADGICPYCDTVLITKAINDKLVFICPNRYCSFESHINEETGEFVIKY